MTKEEAYKIVCAIDTESIESLTIRECDAMHIAIQALQNELSKKVPQGLDEAAEELSSMAYPYKDSEHEYDRDMVGDTREYYQEGFKDGAKWMAEQGLVKETQVYANRWTDVDEVTVSLGQGEYGFKAGDKVIVQIRKVEKEK